MKESVDRTLFADRLRDILDRTELHTRDEWAHLLDVSPAAISQWVNGKTIPRPEYIRMIVGVLEDLTGIDQKYLDAFKEMARRPATEVSRHGRRMLPTVEKYYTRPLFDEESNELAKLSPEAQEEYLNARYPGAEENSVQRETKGIRLPQSSEPKVLPHEVLVPTFEEYHGCVEPLAANGNGVDWGEVAKARHILIVGTAGAGKSVFLRYLSSRLPTHHEPGQLLISGRSEFVQLRMLSDLQTVDQFVEQWDLRAWLSREPARVTLFLDGFDEVNQAKRAQVAQLLNNFHRCHTSTRVIMTSRPVPDLEKFAWMQKWAMRPARVYSLIELAKARLAATLDRPNCDWPDVNLRFSSCLRERPDVFRAIGTPLLVSYIAELYARDCSTACHDGILLDKCIRFLLERWDEEKDVVRFSEPWACPDLLNSWLAGIGYCSYTRDQPQFTYDDVSVYFEGYSRALPGEQVLLVLAESTGILQRCGNRQWRFTHRVFEEFLAAKYIVESSRGALEYLERSMHLRGIGNVLRFACALTNDASPFLSYVLDTRWESEADKFTALATVLSQQMNANLMVIDRACHELVGWMDQTFRRWAPASIVDDDSALRPQWRLSMTKHRDRSDVPDPVATQLLHTLRAVHRARLSPSRKYLHAQLESSSNEALRQVGSCLDIEGYLEGSILREDESDVLIAQVFEA